MNNNSTAVAATIGMSALGMLAYLGYQNIQIEEDDIDKNSDTEAENVESENKETEKVDAENKEPEKVDAEKVEQAAKIMMEISEDIDNSQDLQKQAEDVVKEAIQKKTNEWGDFWQSEYKELKKENKGEIDSEPLPNMYN